MPSIIVFPGQGSQFVGMGKKLLHIPKVSRMFELASHVFKCDLLNVCLNGPSEALNMTDICQPAVFVTSMAAVEYLKLENPLAIRECYATAGFSVGEYSALVLSGAITYEDALKLLKVRSDEMKKACQRTESGLMTTFVGAKSRLDLARYSAVKWCREKLKLEEPVVCDIANYLNAQCKVLGGNKEALDFIELNFREFDIKRIKRLPVNGAFHTKLMEPVEKPLEEMLSKINIKKPIIKFYSNLTGEEAKHPNHIKKNLVYQLSNPVKWEQTLNRFYLNENLPFEIPIENDSDSKPKEKEVVKEFLYSTEQEKNQKESTDKSLDIKQKKSLQTKNRLYPDIYECGPGSVTGPILKIINYKGYKFYKHIEV